MVTVARQAAAAVAPSRAATAGADFRALYDAHFAFVWRTLRRFGVPDAAAEDAAQEVFMILHRRMAELDPGAPVRGYLWGVCRRVAQTQRRGQQRADRRALCTEPPPPAVAPDAALERKRAADFVQAFIDDLPEALREVFVLMEVEGMPAPEVASALSEPVNTVYSRLRLARERFARAAARLRARDAGGRA